MARALVGVVMGSDSDYEAMEPCLKYLEQLGIPYPPPEKQ